MTDRLTLTMPEVAAALGISKRFAYELAQRGELPCVRLGHRVLVRKDALEEWLRAKESA